MDERVVSDIERLPDSSDAAGKKRFHVTVSDGADRSTVEARVPAGVENPEEYIRKFFPPKPRPKDKGVIDI